jgi:hypothetical protein
MSNNNPELRLLMVDAVLLFAAGAALGGALVWGMS